MTSCRSRIEKCDADQTSSTLFWNELCLRNVNYKFQRNVYGMVSDACQNKLILVFGFYILCKFTDINCVAYVAKMFYFVFRGAIYFVQVRRNKLQQIRNDSLAESWHFLNFFNDISEPGKFEKLSENTCTTLDKYLVNLNKIIYTQGHIFFKKPLNKTDRRDKWWAFRYSLL